MPTAMFASEKLDKKKKTVWVKNKILTRNLIAVVLRKVLQRESEVLAS